jgi:hypothetical protein
MVMAKGKAILQLMEKARPSFLQETYKTGIQHK